MVKSGHKFPEEMHSAYTLGDAEENRKGSNEFHFYLRILHLRRVFVNL